MNPQTKEALSKSTEFLKDSVELAHMILKQKLETVRNGGTVSVAEALDAMKEGRATAKQIAQNASLELRDRKLALQEEKAKKERRDSPELEKEPTPEDREKFVALSTEWMAGISEGVRNPDGPATLEYPDELKAMLREYGLDPDRHGSLDALGMWLFPEQAVA